jgi:hypothetical protein
MMTLLLHHVYKTPDRMELVFISRFHFHHVASHPTVQGTIIHLLINFFQYACPTDRRQSDPGALKCESSRVYHIDVTTI